MKLSPLLLIAVFALGVAAPSPAAPPANPLVGTWMANDGEKLVFGPLDKDGEGTVSGLGMAVSYSVSWKKEPAGGFRLGLIHGDDPGLPPSYDGVVAKDGKTLHLTSTPNKAMAKVSGLKPETKEYRKQP